MRSVNFETNTTDSVAGYFMRGNETADIRNYYLPQDHCSIGPDIHDWVMHGIRPHHGASHIYKPCNVVKADIGRK